MFFVYSVVFGGVLCLMPLTIYCLAQASLNHRPRPTWISGPGDLAATLGALSGFLILGGPVVLLGLNSVWRRKFFRGDFAAVGEMLREPAWLWLLVWLAYFLLAVGGAIWLYLRSRRCGVIVNVDPTQCPALLRSAVDKLGLPIDFQSYRAAIGPASRPAVVALRPAPILRSVTVEWHSDPNGIRQAVESKLRQSLAAVDPPVNPVGAWLMAAATALFVVQIVALIMLILFLYYARH